MASGRKHATVLGHAVGDQRGVDRFLRGVDPAEHPAQVAHEQRVVVLDAEGAGIVERPVADEADHRHPQRRRHHQALHRVGPAHAGGAAEHAGADRRGVLDDLELAVLALGHDVLGHQLAVGDLLGDGLDDRVVRADRIAGDHVDVGEGEPLGDGFTARDEQLLLVGCGGRGLGLDCHAGLPYTVLCCAFSPGIPAMISTPPRVEVLLELLLVLAAEAEAVRARRRLLVADLVDQPRLVHGLVLAPHLPLARVVGEDRLVDHGDAVLHRAHRLAHAAAAARLHVGVEGGVGHHVEAGVGARDPAEVALHAGVEVDRPGAWCGSCTS